MGKSVVIVPLTKGASMTTQGMLELAEELRIERDIAQSACTAWRYVFENIEAHLQDRIAMRDQSSPETYLSIIRSAVENVYRDSHAIVNARWADSACHQRHIARLEQELAAARQAPAPAGREAEGVYPHQAIFDAIAAATQIDDGAIEISVSMFFKVLGNHRDRALALPAVAGEGREALIPAGKQARFKNEANWFSVEDWHNNPENFEYRTVYALARQAQEPGEDLNVEAIKERLAEGDGIWMTCSGCHDSVDGHDVRHYPHSYVFGCKLGSGCSECGGIGAIWDTTDYAAMGEEHQSDG